MATGVEMLLKSMGLDPAKLTQDFDALKGAVIQSLTNINQRLERMDKRQEELCQKMEAALRMSSQVQLVQQPQTQPQQQPEVQQPVPMQPLLVQRQP